MALGFATGTWTPVLATTGTQPTGVTYSSQDGIWMRIGNTIFFSIRVLLTNKGSGGTGNARFSLPFVVDASSLASATGALSDTNLPAGRTMTSLGFASGVAFCTAIASGDNTSLSTITWAQLTNTSALRGSGHYYTTNIRVDLEMDAGPAVYMLTGMVASAGLSAAFAAGSFALSGVAALLHYGKQVSADVGSFVLTGVDATFVYGKNLAAEVGAFVLTGVSALLHKGISMVAAAGSFALTGIAALIHGSLTLAAATGQFAVSGWQTLLQASNDLLHVAKSILPKRAPREVDPSLRKTRTDANKLRRI